MNEAAATGWAGPPQKPVEASLHTDVEASER